MQRCIGRHGGLYAIRSIVAFILEHFGVKKQGSNAFITGPGRYRKVEENSRKKSPKFAGCIKLCHGQKL